MSQIWKNEKEVKEAATKIMQKTKSSNFIRFVFTIDFDIFHILKTDTVRTNIIFSSVFSRIYLKYVVIRTRKNLVFRHFSRRNAKQLILNYK